MTPAISSPLSWLSLLYILTRPAVDRNQMLIQLVVFYWWTQTPNLLPLHPNYLITESGPGGGSSGHHLRQREGHRLLEALHDTGNKYPVPQAQRHQPRSLLLPQSPLARYLDVYSAGLLGCQLCAVCHSQVTCQPSLPFPFFLPHSRLPSPASFPPSLFACFD